MKHILTLDRQTLLPALSNVAAVVKPNAERPILTHVYVKFHDGELTLIGSSPDAQMTSKIQVQSDLVGGLPDMEFTVGAKKFLDIVRTVTSDTINLELGENVLKVSSGRSRFTLDTLPADSYPFMPIEKGTANTFVLSAEQVSDCIRATAFSCAKNDSRYYLNGLKVELSGDKLRTVGTDGHRLSTQEVKMVNQNGEPLNFPEMGFIVPNDAVSRIQNLLKGLKGEVNLTVMPNSITLDLGSLQFTAKLIDGRFPDYKRVLPRVVNRTYKVNTQELKGVINRCLLIANMSTNKFAGVAFKFENTNLNVALVKVQSAECADEDLDMVQVGGENGEFIIGLNGTYVQDALSAITTEYAIMNFDSPQAAVKIEPHYTDEEKAELNKETMFIVMPMRL